MRISDLMVSNNYLGHFNSIKDRISKLNQQILTGQKISKPSDSPVGTSKLLRIFDQMSQTDAYRKNVQSSLTFIDETIFALESIQNEVQSVIKQLTQLQDPINQGDLDLQADIIDSSLKLIMDLANSKSDGKYVFGGTDFTSKPYGFSSDNQTIETLTDTNGKLNVRFTQSITQNINLTGTNVFGTVVSFGGIIDVNAAVGTDINSTHTIYDNYGKQYEFRTTLNKTDASTFQLTYDILDSNGVSVFSTPPVAKEVKFNPSNGQIVSVDGSTNPIFDIDVPSKRIHFSVNMQSLTEKNSATSVNLSANQQSDIFNMLKRISTNLRNDILPTEAERESIKNFLDHIVGKTTEAGNTINQITTIDGMLNQQNNNLQEAAEAENGVDIAKAIMELQNQEYLLQISQKMAAMILPKSLLDYL